LRRTYRLKGETLLGKTIRATMSKRAGKTASYFAVEFEIISNGKYAEAISQFRQLHYSPDFIRLSEPKKDDKEEVTTASNSNGKKAK